MNSCLAKCDSRPKNDVGVAWGVAGGGEERRREEGGEKEEWGESRAIHEPNVSQTGDKHSSNASASFLALADPTASAGTHRVTVAGADSSTGRWCVRSAGSQAPERLCAYLMSR